MGARSFLFAIGLPLLLGGATPAPPETAPPPWLSPPLACGFGQDCFIQQYVDHDAGPGAKDYRCGPRSYDGHKGTDFRLSTLAAQRRGVPVLAAAGGMVRAIRADMDDRLIEDGDSSAVKGKECGNGVLVDARGGWELQYCHMAKGSILVKPGQMVKSGDPLGRVGLSGDTEFPHLHLSVRQQGRIVDPFAPALDGNSCADADGGKPLWSAAAARLFAYRESEIINAGFADGPVTETRIEAETLKTPDRRSPALAYYARLIGVRKGDVLRLAITAPDGSGFASKDHAIDRDQAVRWAFVGKRADKNDLARGRYRASAILIRSGRVAARREDSLTLN